jgi:5-methylcytosine-specific restriction endonuclease McrA
MEATPTDSTPVATGPGEASSKTKQSRIPSAQASSFRKATDTTKNAVITRDNRKCWLCGVGWSPSLDVAHNVGASIPLGRVCSSLLFISLVHDFSRDSADDVQLEIWKRLGILPAAFYPAHVDNLILLCKNCHSGYNCDYPGWIIIPHNLDFFINFERKNYAARIAAATSGDRQWRALPEVPFRSLF